MYKSEPRKYSLHTTRSWEFSGVEESVAPNYLNKDDLLLKARYGKNIIIGVLDSGTFYFILFIYYTYLVTIINEFPFCLKFKCISNMDTQYN